MDYARPTELTEALGLLAERSWTVLAGGTDLYPATQDQQLSGNVLDISALADLRGIADLGTVWRIGARTTWSDIREASLPPSFRALQLAAAEVGGIQIQNSGTIAGNLCNASPAADGVPALLVLDAVVDLASSRGVRSLPLGAFLKGPRQTARANDELLVAITIPKESAVGVSDFQKLGARRYLVISIAMAAVRLDIQDNTVSDAAIAVGACSGVATRLPDIERSVVGCAAGGIEARVQEHLVAQALSPIDDVRGSAGYRAEAAAELIRRALRQAKRDAA